MTGTDLCVNKPHCAAAVRPWESEATTSTLPPARLEPVQSCLGVVRVMSNYGYKKKSVPVIFEPPCTWPCLEIRLQEINNSSFERVEQFRYLGTTLANQNSIQEEITSRLKSGNACCHSVQNILSSGLLSKNINIKIYRTLILPVVCGCETWSLTFRQELRLRVFANRTLRIYGHKRDEVTKKCKNYTMRSLIICSPCPILSGW